MRTNMLLGSSSVCRAGSPCFRPISTQSLLVSKDSGRSLGTSQSVGYLYPNTHYFTYSLWSCNSIRCDECVGVAQRRVTSELHTRDNSPVFASLYFPRLACTLIGWLLEFYVLATYKAISGRNCILKIRFSTHELVSLLMVALVPKNI